MSLKYQFEEIWHNNDENVRKTKIAEALRTACDTVLINMAMNLNTKQTTGLTAMFGRADELDSIFAQTMRFISETVYPLNGLPAPALIAVGGYGRKELAPYSDVDILFLLIDDTQEEYKKIVSLMTSLLWDAGLKIGASARTPIECIAQAKQDMSIRTNLLEARFVWGNVDLFNNFHDLYEQLRTQTNALDFVEAKLLERSKRHEKMGKSRYMLEPNVKEGRGGLRDLHLMFWFAKYLFDITDMPELVDKGILSPVACQKFLKAHKFLATVRCHLHLLSGKAGDILTFDAQQKIAEQMGYVHRTGQCAVERFMKHYYLICKNVGELTRLITVLIKDRLTDTTILKDIDAVEFFLTNNRIAFKEGLDLKENPLAILKAFALKQSLKLPINPQTLQYIADNAKLTRLIRNTPEAKNLFFEILLSDNAVSSLRQMIEARVLGYFIPEFQKLVGQVQFDLYHIYTTDEHTLHLIQFLSDLDKDIMPESKRVLYTAGLLHDIGKGRGGEHACVGAEISQRIVYELGLENEEAETVLWLIRHHLFMTQTAFRRDIFDPKTIEDFVAVVQSPERLRLLYALSVADIKAVGPSVWNSFKDKLLSDLFSMSLEKMQGENVRVRDLTPTQQALLEKSSDEKYRFSLTTDEQRAVSEFIVLAPDHNGLFAEITGALALEDLSVVEAQILTLENGYALDTFLIEETNMLNETMPLTSEKKYERLKSHIKASNPEVIDEKLSQKRSKSTTQTLWCPPRVFIDNTASNQATLIEINSTDAIGFLHAITHTMTKLELKIISAHIYTYGSRVVDVFYVTDKNDNKITHENTMKQIKKTLLDTINDGTFFNY